MKNRKPFSTFPPSAISGSCGCGSRLSTILTAPAAAHNDRLLHIGEYPTGILSSCDRCLGEYVLVLQVNEAKATARS